MVEPTPRGRERGPDARDALALKGNPKIAAMRGADSAFIAVG